jgi:hypothetical protein
MVVAMQEAGVPPQAAKPLAREGVSLAMLKQFGINWAAGVLAERHIVLNQRHSCSSWRPLRRRQRMATCRWACSPAAAGAGELRGAAGAAATAGGKALVLLRVRDARLQVQGVVERGAQPEVLQEVRARAPVCSQQFGGSPNHDEPSVVPAGWTAERMPKKKDALPLVDTLHGMGITATRDPMMKSTKQELVAQAWAAQLRRVRGDDAGGGRRRRRARPGVKLER